MESVSQPAVGGNKWWHWHEEERIRGKDEKKEKKRVLKKNKEREREREVTCQPSPFIIWTKWLPSFFSADQPKHLVVSKFKGYV